MPTNNVPFFDIDKYLYEELHPYSAEKADLSFSDSVLWRCASLKSFDWFSVLTKCEATLAKTKHNKTVPPCFCSPSKMYREYPQAQLPTCQIRVHWRESSSVFSLSSSSEPLSAWKAAVALRSNAALNLPRSLMALKQLAALMVTFEAVIEVPPRDEVTAGVNRLPGFFPAIIHRFILSLTLRTGRLHTECLQTQCAWNMNLLRASESLPQS